jgi:hypothetical protein
VVVDHDARQPLEELRVALGDRADTVERTAVADDEQVVVDGGIGSVRALAAPGRKS